MKKEETKTNKRQVST